MTRIPEPTWNDFCVGLIQWTGILAVVLVVCLVIVASLLRNVECTDFGRVLDVISIGQYCADKGGRAP